MNHTAVADLVLYHTPPAPSPGGGRRRRRSGRPAWGIAPIAVDPDLWVGGQKRRRLVRAATLTSVMGVAWAGSTTLPPADPGELGTSVEGALAEEDAPGSSPVRYERGAEGAQPAEEGLRAARTGGTSVAPEPSAGSARRGQPAAAEKSDPDAWRRNVIATWGDVEIVQPSPKVRMIGFHEGGSRADDVRPGATPHRDLGAEPVASERRRDDLPSMVLPDRGRGTGAASAIDIALPDGQPFYAPITGTVTAANEYTLYGKHPDTIITIQPDGHPEVMMEILHVEGVQVEVGDRVVAGRTVLAASANKLPFGSQIDRFVTERGKALPHVHVEMQRTG